MKFRVKSVRVKKVEEPVPHSGRTVIKLRFDVATVQDHEIESGFGDLLRDRVWIRNVFVAGMGMLALFGIAYGALFLGMKIDVFSGSGRSYGFIFICLFAVGFLSLWASLSIPGAIKNRKQQVVDRERGEGTWKVVDEKDWDRFYKYTVLANEMTRAKFEIPKPDQPPQ